MRSIVWADSAKQDLASIDNWFSNIDPSYADQAGEAAIAAARFLVEFPFAGSIVKGELRKWSVANTKYRVFYKVGLNTIEIVRVRHVREDWQSA